MAIASVPPLSQRAPRWIRQVAQAAMAEPLVDTAASMTALSSVTTMNRPGAVLVGIGLCTSTELSHDVPLDLLGMLLPAERLRRACGAGRLIAVVADEHARVNGFHDVAVERCARATISAVQWARDICGLDALTIAPASTFHASPAYRALLDDVSRRLPPELHEYVARQVADVVHVGRAHGGVLKVGWAVRGAWGPGSRDERAFDRWLTDRIGGRAAFVYCKPGRSMSDQAPRAVPYLTTEPQTRVCLRSDEDPAAVLERPASPSTAGAMYRHLRAILYTFGREVAPITGANLATRVERLLARTTAVSTKVPPAALP